MSLQVSSKSPHVHSAPQPFRWQGFPLRGQANSAIPDACSKLKEQCFELPASDAATQKAHAVLADVSLVASVGSWVKTRPTDFFRPIEKFCHKHMGLTKMTKFVRQQLAAQIDPLARRIASDMMQGRITSR